MLQSTRVFSLCIVVLLMLSGCDSNSIDDDDQNGPQLGQQFSLDISGDVEQTMDGSAFFGEADDPDSGAEVFAVYLTESDGATGGASMWAVVGRAGDRPGTGTYSFVDASEEDEYPADEFVLSASIGSDATDVSTFVSQGGELTITESSSNRVEGTIDVDATGFHVVDDEVQELDVTIVGSFEAVGSSDIFVPGL